MQGVVTQSPEPEAHVLLYVFERSGSNWNLEVLVFEERGKPEYPGENLLEQRKNQQQT